MTTPTPYINLSASLIGNNTEPFLKKCDINPEKKYGFGTREVLTRMASFGSSIGVAFTGIADTFIGLGCALGAIAAGGRSKTANQYTFNHLNSLNRFITRPHKYLVQTLNPHARFTPEGRISSKGDGLITNFVKEKLNAALKSCTKPERNWAMRHIVSRLTIGLRTIASLITRIVDFPIGLIAGLFSLLSLGTCESLNNTAFRGLQVTGIVTDLLEGVVQLLNPKAEVRVGFYDYLNSFHAIT
jgi:hypothetical protein